MIKEWKTFFATSKAIPSTCKETGTTVFAFLFHVNICTLINIQTTKKKNYTDYITYDWKTKVPISDEECDLHT